MTGSGELRTSRGLLHARVPHVPEIVESLALRATVVPTSPTSPHANYVDELVFDIPAPRTVATLFTLTEDEITLSEDLSGEYQLSLKFLDLVLKFLRALAEFEILGTNFEGFDVCLRCSLDKFRVSYFGS